MSSSIIEEEGSVSLPSRAYTMSAYESLHQSRMASRTRRLRRWRATEVFATLRDTTTAQPPAAPPFFRYTTEKCALDARFEAGSAETSAISSRERRKRLANMALDSKLCAPLATTALQHLLAARRFCAREEAVRCCTLALLRLIGSFWHKSFVGSRLMVIHRIVTGCGN